jgi:hypothetical protein
MSMGCSNTHNFPFDGPPRIAEITAEKVKDDYLEGY